METKVKNREWVKDAAIVFLAVLLVLTFFSNTIMNRTLPEVATAAVHEGAIVAKVRGTGTVTATGKHQVKAKETRTVRSVMVKVGQEVKAGDVLFVLGEGDETELEQAKERLRNLQTSYQKTALSMPIYDYSSYNRAIESAQNTLERAERELSEAMERADEQSYPAVTQAAYQRYLDAKDEAEKLEKEYETKKQERLQEILTQLDMLTQEKVSLEQQAEPYVEKVAECQAACDALQEPISFWENEKQRAQEVFDAISDPGSGADLAKRQEAESDLTNAINSLAAYQEQLIEAERELNEAITERDAILGATYQQILNRIAEYEAEYTALENDELHYDEVREAIEKRDRLYNEYLEQIGSTAKEVENAEYAVRDAEIALQAAYDSLAYAEENNNRSAAQTGVELQSIAEEIRLQQEKIKSLAGDESNTVLADVPGTVSTVDCTAGDTVLKNALMATLEVPDMGYTLSFSVTGDVVAGSELSISVGQKSANYDLVVPNSAVKSDSNGSFVLAVAVKSSPLGNRYTARRVSVEVRANDDNNSAVVGDLSNGDYVITTSSAPIKSGDMVRLADSD